MRMAAAAGQETRCAAAPILSAPGTDHISDTPAATGSSGTSRQRLLSGSVVALTEGVVEITKILQKVRQP